MQHIAIMLRARQYDNRVYKKRNKRARIECDQRLIYVFSNHMSDRSNGNISYLIIYALEPALAWIGILAHKVYSLHFDCSWGLLYCLYCNLSLFHLIRSLKIVPEKLLKQKRKIGILIGLVYQWNTVIYAKHTERFTVMVGTRQCDNQVHIK